MNIVIRKMLVCLLVGVTTAAVGMEDARLKEWLSGNFIAPESMRWEEIDEFKKGFSVTDEQLYRILMGMYREAENKWTTLTPKTLEWHNNNRTVEGVLGWLPKCGDIPVKEFLMDYATTKENDSWLRRSAILSYLREADAEETKNALLRFLVEGDRMDDYARSSIYVYAKTVWDTASHQKKAAIFNALCVAASTESPHWVFEECDRRLIAMDARYKDSTEREAMLRHQLTIPFSKYYGELKNQMEQEVVRLKKSPRHPVISTNIAALKARNFNLPIPVGEINGLMQAVSDPAYPEPMKTEKNGLVSQQVGFGALLGGISVVLIGFCIWMFARK
jgi:hypothetical protein